MEDKYKISFDEIRALLQENQYQQDDINSLEKAFEFAKKLHDGQFRISEEPYIIHPMEVVKILISFSHSSFSFPLISTPFYHSHPPPSLIHTFLSFMPSFRMPFI